MSKKKQLDAQAQLDFYNAATERYDKIFGHLCTLTRIMTTGGILTYLTYAVNAYLQHGAEKISAVATVVSAFKLEVIVPVIAAGISLAAFKRERHGKQRAIKKGGAFRKRLEREDPNRTSSGLTEIGTTPEDD